MKEASAVTREKASVAALFSDTLSGPPVAKSNQ
jgi:hypothetical protein